jgi:cytochrome P450
VTTLVAPNLASGGFKADPHPFYARLREEAPVFHVRLSGRRQGWLLTRYDDVAEALRDRRLGKDKRSGDASARRAHIPFVTDFLGPLERNMLDLDPPDHTRLRGLVHKAFTPRLVERLRERVQSLTDAYLDRVAAKGKIELVADYALPLPATIIAEMLGVPAEDRHRFHAWSSKVVTVGSAINVRK